MTLALDLKTLFKSIATDIKAVANRVGFLEKSLNYLTTKISIARSEEDVHGVYRCITHRRANGSLLQVSRLEFDPTLELINGTYNKRVTTIYSKDGNDVTDVTVYQLKYDANNVIVSETLIP